MSEPGDWYIGRGESLQLAHNPREEVEEGSDPRDLDYVYPAPWEGQWAPKPYSRIGTRDLISDCRPTNSLSDFHFRLAVIIQDGEPFVGTHSLSIKIGENSIYSYIPTNEHWIISYSYYTNYYVGGAARCSTRNLRELCPQPNEGFDWVPAYGMDLNIPSSAIGTNDEVVFAEGVWHKEFNTLTVISGPGGTSSHEDTLTFAYGTNCNVSLTADPGYALLQYALTLTDDIGNRTTTTNILAFPTNAVAVALHDLKGSNALYSSFAMLRTTNGIPHPWLLAHDLPTTDNVETNNPDGDPFNTFQEWIADTNPTNSDSFFPPLCIISTGGLPRLSIEPTSTARLYRVNCTTNLVNKFDPYTNSMGTGADLLFPVNSNVPQGFYRSSVEIPKE